MSVVAVNDEEYSSPTVMRQGTLADGDRQPDLSVVLGELQNSAQLTATTASIANTMVTRPGLLSDTLLSCYLPPLPKRFPQANARLSALTSTSPLAARLGKYYAELASQRLLIEEFCERSTALAVEREQRISAIADSWRALAAQAIAAIEEMSPCAPASKTRPNSDRTELLCHLLRSAAAGAAPCVDPYGVVVIPSWVDRRKEARELRGFQAILQVEESLQRVAVLDASEFGIGVLGLTNAREGSRVGLLIKPGYKLNGTVIWVDGTRAGIRLHSRLPANSRLLEHLS